MELNPIQSYSYMQSTAVTAAEKKTNDESADKITDDRYGKDTVEISADASFKSELGTYSKNLASKELAGASQERISELTGKYNDGKCPVASSAIASAILGYTFGTQGQGQ